MLRNMNSEVMKIERQGGELAIEVSGEGPLLLCVPGMGDLRSEFRHLTPGLAAAGYRVAVMDLRGHGESSVAFESYDDEATAGDITAVIEALGGPATVIGNSMGAAAAVLAAAERPDLVDRLVLIGPFVRDHGSFILRGLMRAALLRPWGPLVWRKYFASLFPSGGPEDQAEHAAAVSAALARPGRWRAFQRTARTSHAPAEAALPEVTAPTLVVMGEEDPDFSDPEAEARWVADALGGSFEMIAEAGHYPMAERAGRTLEVILGHLSQNPAHG
ncbi:MAG: hypothetical protein BGO23_09320 [Solirubrobacterales bacterium 67-14]|nr:MAG: hypothetical protein BGO23_09320 [Solirubrobacterales bacterium 67-14]